MKAIIFGATGMVGQGVMRECLLDPSIETVLTVGRRPTGQKHEKLREIVHQNSADFSTIETELAGYDACFFCLGIGSTGLSEQEYHRITYGIVIAAAQTLVKLNPGMTFVYISGRGADSSERGRTMWARVKGKTENALLAMPFKATYIFRPAYIEPLHGIQSRTRLYRFFYAVIGPMYPLWKMILPNYVTTTEQLARAMIRVARQGGPKHVLESQDISRIS